MNADLAAFISSGALGPLELGMNDVRIHGLLGAADDTGVPSRSGAWTVWKYADLELGFFKRTLISIAIYIREGRARVPRSVLGEGTIPIAGTLDAFLDDAAASGVALERDAELCNDEHLVYRHSSGVGVYVDAASRRIQSIQYAGGRSPRVRAKRR